MTEDNPWDEEANVPVEELLAYITDLEEENENLSEQNRELIERIKELEWNNRVLKE